MRRKGRGKQAIGKEEIGNLAIATYQIKMLILIFIRIINHVV
jgi:hypothetical protein